MRKLLALTATLVACAPTSSGPTDSVEAVGPGCIAVEPVELDFGSVDVRSPGEQASAAVTVRNVCPGVLEILSAEIDGGDALFFERASPGQGPLAQGEALEIELSFTPSQAKPYASELILRSSDPDTPRQAVPLAGIGHGPRISVSPDRAAFGSPFIGCESVVPLEVYNLGTAPLRVNEVSVFSATPERFALDLRPAELGPLPLTVAPGEHLTVELGYIALGWSEEEAFVSVRSDDPLQPEVVVPASGSGQSFGTAEDRFTRPSTETDILFVVDRSCSMADNFEPLFRDIRILTEELKASGVDYHLGAVVGSPGCLAGPETTIDATFSASEAARTFETMVDRERTYVPYTAPEERGIALAKQALSTDNVGLGGCNESFYRRDAGLSIVHVTDEGAAGAAAWSDYVAFAEALKRDPATARIHAIAGDYPSGCSTASPGAGYYEAASATGGLFLSICDTDWRPHMEDLATASTPVTNAPIQLSGPAVPQTLDVRVNGERQSRGWSYDAESHTIEFIEGMTPPSSSIEVRYHRLPECED